MQSDLAKVSQFSTLFDLENLNEFHLLLIFEHKHLNIVIKNQEKLIGFENHEIDTTEEKNELAQLIEIWEDSIFLKAQFWKSVSCIFEPLYSFSVPSDLFEEELVPKYLEIFYEEKWQKNKYKLSIYEMSAAKQLELSHKFLADFIKTQYPEREINYLGFQQYLNENIKENTLYFTEKQVFQNLNKTHFEALGFNYEWDDKLTSGIVEAFGLIQTNSPFYKSLGDMHIETLHDKQQHFKIAADMEGISKTKFGVWMQ
jgi:hypothetical protein